MTKSVQFILPSALTPPSWATGGVREDHEQPFAGKEVELELFEFCRGESYVNGEEMLKRSLAKSPTGNRTFEYLATHQELIPEEWRKFVLVFPGTVLLDGSGDRDVQYLYFYDGRWFRSDDWLSNGFRSCCRVVGFRK